MKAMGFARRAVTISAMTALVLSPALLSAAKVRRSTRSKKAPQVHAQVVDFFAGRNAGKIEVQFIPKNARQATVKIKNKTDKPISIKLPEAFAAVPTAVLAQMGGMGGGMGGGGMGGGGMGGMGGGGMGGGGGGGQGMGGGMGGGGMGGGGMGGGGMGGGGMGGGGMGGGGGGMFNLEPSRERKIKVETLCLEEGKKDPTPRMKYTMIPIERFTKQQDVIELCKMVGNGQVPRNSAQAAAWHLTDKLSWWELANKDRIRLSNGYFRRYFSPREIGYAIRIANEAVRRGQQSQRSSLASDDVAKLESLSNQ